jgi:hypothetical protein
MLLYSVSKRAFMGTTPVWETYEERARFWRVKWAGARAGARAWIVVRDRVRVRERNTDTQTKTRLHKKPLRCASGKMPTDFDFRKLIQVIAIKPWSQ